MDKLLKSFEFERPNANPTLYVKQGDESSVLPPVYVDKIMIFGSSDESINKVVDRFKAHFEIRVEPEIWKLLDILLWTKEVATNSTTNQ